MKKKILLGFIFVMILFGTVACKNDYFIGNDGEEIDSSKTQLYVQSFEGGYGSEWLYKAKERFEKKYESVEFTTGKHGVQIIISKPKVDGIGLRTSNTGSNEIFFNESVYYYDYINSGYVLDITDAVVNPLVEVDENKSIEDKMTPEQIDYYKTKDQKYYGVPHYAGYNGIAYDIDLFEENLLFFNDKGNLMVNEDETKSTGPDKIMNTSDDGLPSTYEEFYQLCDYMVEIGIVPFVWCGQYYNTYIEKVLYALCADYDGLEETMINYTFQGNSKKIINEVSNDGEYTYMNRQEGIEITPKNAYLLWASEGKYKSLKFFEKIIKNSDYYTSLAFSPSYFNTEAQKDFIESSSKGKPIAMILEGCWFENEAKDAIKSSESNLQRTRNFGWMNLPKASEDLVGQKSTLVDTHYSLGFIKATIDKNKIELAKTFLRFCCSDESLNEFTVVTNTVKSLQYELTPENYNKLTSFGKNVYDIHKASNVVYPYSSEPVYLDNQSLFTIHNTYGSKIDTREEAHPILYLRTNKENNAEDYFNGMIKYNQQRWNLVFGGYFE